MTDAGINIYRRTLDEAFSGETDKDVWGHYDRAGRPSDQDENDYDLFDMEVEPEEIDEDEQARLEELDHALSRIGLKNGGRSAGSGRRVRVIVARYRPRNALSFVGLHKNTIAR